MSWQRPPADVLTFDSGVARGRSNGTATIIGVHQGLTTTRLIRVVTDYQGFWVGDYAVRRCEDSGDWASGDFCDRQTGFYVGQLLEIALDLRQQGDAVTGDVALGALEGTTSGSVGTGGRLAATGSMTFDSEGLPIAFALNPMNFGGDGDRLTGRFTVTVTAPGLRGRACSKGNCARSCGHPPTRPPPCVPARDRLPRSRSCSARCAADRTGARSPGRLDSSRLSVVAPRGGIQQPCYATLNAAMAWLTGLSVPSGLRMP